MNNILVKVNNLDELNYPVRGFIFGIENFCVCFEKTFNIKELEEIKNKCDNKIYACLNRVIFNNEVEEYKKVLLELDRLNLDGIFVSDIAALTYNLKTNIILDQGHLNNSFQAINHFYNNNVSGIFLTNDITEEEINNINTNTKCTLYKQIFGLAHLSTSRRKLVSNYLEYSKIKSNDNLHFIKEENSENYYYIYEDYFGTHIFNSNILNLLGKNINLNVDYYIFDSFLLDKDKFKKILIEYIKNCYVDKSKVDKYFNNDLGFNYTKTIYRVKNNE